MAERIQPFEHAPPDGIGGKIRFQLRLFLDFQVRTVYDDLKGLLPQVKGKVLDIGCGLGPYKHLFNPQNSEYIGLDIDQASHFGYGETGAIRFDGQRIPFPDASIDFILCTEVLEHVRDPQLLVDETCRVLKAGGSGVFTVPWSARVHYFPFDYHRFTPFVLKDMFQGFSCTITPRGTDITAIISKIMVVYLRNFQMTENVLLMVPRLLFMVVFVPFMVLCVLTGYLSLIFHWGSPDDPLGWTVYLQKVEAQ
jgi:SAM-dependent methyltransferase